MSSLRFREKKFLEEFLNMRSGNVRGLTDESEFKEFFSDPLLRIDIDDDRYTKNGNSRADRMRVFLEEADDSLVLKCLEELLSLYRGKGHRLVNPRTYDTSRMYGNYMQVIDRLRSDSYENEDMADIPPISLANVDIDLPLKEVLEARLEEAVICFNNEAYLSTIFMAGSVLEGILLDIASKNPKEFNQSSACPKDGEENPRRFSLWTLANFIDVAHETKFLDIDTTKFSHALRDFRNYIHPREQMKEGFKPDRSTAEICLKVLEKAIKDLEKRIHHRGRR